MAAEAKNFSSPDETRPFKGNGQAKAVELAGHTVLEGTFEPGWKWSENVKPIAGTDSCQAAHFGYVLSGSMRVYMDDGTELRSRPATWRRSRRPRCRGHRLRALRDGRLRRDRRLREGIARQ